MNIEFIEFIASYLWFLIESRGLQWALVRVRVSEIGGRQHARRGNCNSKH